MKRLQSKTGYPGTPTSYTVAVKALDMERANASSFPSKHASVSKPEQFVWEPEAFKTSMNVGTQMQTTALEQTN